MKIKALLLCLTVCLLLSACSSRTGASSSSGSSAESGSISVSSTEEPEAPEPSSAPPAEPDDVEIDENIREVEITLPPSVVTESADATLSATDRANGIQSKMMNADGSLTIVFSKSGYERFLTDFRAQVVAYFDEMTGDGSFASLKSVGYNDSLTAVTLTVDRALYEDSMDGFAVFGVGMMCSIYQAYAGTPESDLRVEISLMDAATSEVFETLVYPEKTE